MEYDPIDIEFFKLNGNASTPVSLSNMTGVLLESCEGEEPGEQNELKQIVIYPGEVKAIHTGLSVDIEEGYYLQLVPRSDKFVTNTCLEVVNVPGLINSNFGSEIVVLLKNTSAGLGLTSEHIPYSEVLDIDEATVGRMIRKPGESVAYRIRRGSILCAAIPIPVYPISVTVSGNPPSPTTAPASLTLTSLNLVSMAKAIASTYCENTQGRYSQEGHPFIDITYNAKTISSADSRRDCSSLVCGMLYLGGIDSKYMRNYTGNLINGSNGGTDVTSQCHTFGDCQVGDYFVMRSGNSGHTAMITFKDDEYVYFADCGASSYITKTADSGYAQKFALSDSVSKWRTKANVLKIFRTSMDPSITLGDTIDFANCPYNKFSYTFMGWQMITSPSSSQFKWRQGLYPDWANGKNAEGSNMAFDNEGFGIANGRYVVAVSSKADGGIGEIGKTLDVYLANGEVINCIVGDIKSAGDPNWTIWGHLSNSTTINVIEFIVNRHNPTKPQWYDESGSGDHPNPGSSSCHPEWHSDIIKIIREE